MLINDKVDAVFIPDSPSRIKATDYNQIKNEIQECITEAGLTPTKDVIQLPQALKILTAQSGAEEVAKIEAAGQEQLDAINTAGAQAVQDAQTAANTATAKAAEAADSAAAANSASGAATSKANAAAASAAEAETAKTDAQSAQTAAEAAKTAAQSAKTAAESAKTQAAASASQASQSAIDAANSAASARGLQIGAVYFSQSSLATDNPGALPLWTGEYYSNASSLYPDFYNWVKSHTELCKSKTEYDAAISTYGECPYYVVDEVSGSLRLPKLVNYLKMANATDGITQAQAGLPNITGTGLFWEDKEDQQNQLTGCFFVDTNKKNNLGSGRSDYDNVSVAMDASRSSAIYGKSSTVTPAHTTLYPWVYAFNSAVSASEAQAAEVTDALVGKADTDLSNVSSNIDYVVETYRNGNAWYRVYKSGWLEQGGLTGSIGQSSTTTVTFPKPFAHNQYCALLTAPAHVNYTGSQRQNWNVENRTNTSMSVRNNVETKSNQYIWYACGQGA